MEKKYGVFLLIFLVVTIWSCYGAFDRVLWILEAGICVVGVGILIATFKCFRLTDLTYIFILIHISKIQDKQIETITKETGA